MIDEDEIVAQTLDYIEECDPGLAYTGDYLCDLYGDDFNYHAIVDRIEEEGLATCRDPRHAMIITNFGRKIVQAGGYLKYRLALEAKEIEKAEASHLERERLIHDIKNLKWQHKMRWWPHIIAVISLMVAIASLIISLTTE